MNPEILRLVLVTERARYGTARFVEAVLDAARRHGATMILLREKDLDVTTLAVLASDLVARASVPVVVAHRPEVAKAVSADGVQLGEAGPSVAEARAVLGPGPWIGRSVHSVEGGVSAAAAGADYLVLGPIRETPKPFGTPTPLGFAALRMLAERVAIPVVAIGGLDTAHAAEVARTGAAGLAAIRAFAPQPAVGEGEPSA